MKSGWFFGTTMWEEYMKEYAKSRPECLHEWKSSPLCNDHDFSKRKMNCSYVQTEHQSQVIDISTHKWGDVRKSYHSLIHRGLERLIIEESRVITPFRLVHHMAFGSVRSLHTFVIQQGWIASRHAMAVTAEGEKGDLVAAALWIIYQGCAYYASGPSVERNSQHAVIWKSLQLLKARGVEYVELGQIDGETEKEKNIGKFKQGFGGEAKPFTVVRRIL